MALCFYNGDVTEIGTAHRDIRFAVGGPTRMISTSETPKVFDGFINNDLIFDETWSNCSGDDLSRCIGFYLRNEEPDRGDGIKRYRTIATSGPLVVTAKKVGKKPRSRLTKNQMHMLRAAYHAIQEVKKKGKDPLFNPTVEL